MAGLSWMFCGGGFSAWLVRGDAWPVVGGAVWVGMGNTTCSFHGGTDVLGRTPWAPFTFVATSSLSTAWLMYGSRSLPIAVSAGPLCPGCEPDGSMPCVAPDRFASRKCSPECAAATMLVACSFAVFSADTS
jgi:hypothetical protein